MDIERCMRSKWNRNAHSRTTPVKTKHAHETIRLDFSYTFHMFSHFRWMNKCLQNPLCTHSIVYTWVFFAAAFWFGLFFALLVLLNNRCACTPSLAAAGERLFKHLHISLTRHITQTHHFTSFTQRTHIQTNATWTVRSIRIRRDVEKNRARIDIGTNAEKRQKIPAHLIQFYLTIFFQNVEMFGGAKQPAKRAYVRSFKVYCNRISFAQANRYFINTETHEAYYVHLVNCLLCWWCTRDESHIAPHRIHIETTKSIRSYM